MRQIVSNFVCPVCGNETVLWHYVCEHPEYGNDYILSYDHWCCQNCGSYEVRSYHDNKFYGDKFYNSVSNIERNYHE